MVWLVAEDETDIRVLITTMIQVWGHNTVAYENGQKVWDWLDKLDAGEPLPAPPDLVLMDIRMPGKKGNEVAARMRNLPAFARTPIVLMTAFTMNDAERREMIERDGADRIIQKPLPEFEALRKLLHDAISEKQAAPPAPPAPVEAPAATLPEAEPAPDTAPVEAQTTILEAKSVPPAPEPAKAETPAPESREPSKASVPKSL